MTSFNQKKIIVQEIQDNFNAKAVIFYNFHHGVENRDIFQLKRELKKVGSHWKVYKNNLVKKALPSYPLELKQANAFVFCQEDEYKPLSILAQFNKEHANIKRFQGGLYEQKLIDSFLLEKWANLPSQEVLLSTLCYYLSWQTRRLINVLEKLKENKVK
jgi:large subunit ribosomal protein L10